MLLDLNTEEFMNMTKELGLSTWGQRRNLKKAIEDHKAKNENLVESDKYVEDVDSYVEDVDNHVENVIVEDECELCQNSTQNKCKKCKKQVCNLFCSVQDPNSDNEAHRMHKPVDKRCTSSEGFPCSECDKSFESKEELNSHQEFEHSEVFQGNLEQIFECPSCNSLFKTGGELQNHVEVTHEQHSSLSLLSHVSSDSWMHVTCTICDMVFENDGDMKHHKERVHEYGETCNIYPCEDCGFQGQDIRSLKQHISESHDETCLEQLGIKQLPYYSKRIKQNFNSLSIDKDGSFEVEESEEEYEMEETIVNNSRKRRVTERLQTKKRPKV